MERRKPWITGLLVVALALVVLVIAVALLAPVDEVLRDRTVAEIRARYGIELTVSSVHLQVLPVPMVVIHNATTRQPQPLAVRQLTAVLNLPRTLSDWRISLDRIELDGAVIPTISLAAFRQEAEPGPGDASRVAVGHLHFVNVTWISRTGIPLPIEGEIDFDPHWRPRQAQVRRARFEPAARITLVREGGADRWSARVALGGGTAEGQLELTTADDGLMVLGGTLRPLNVEVASAAESLNRRSPVTGKADGNTTVSARGRTAGELGRSLRVLTEFRMAPATILRVDVDRAIRTLGLRHDGRTALSELTGVMDLQNTGRGTVIRFRDIRAEGDTFTATGEGTVFNRQLDARGQLHLVKGIIAVPFVLRGPVRQARMSLGDGVAERARPAAAGQRAAGRPGSELPAGVRDEG